MIMIFDVERFWLATLSVLSPRVFLHNMFRALHQPRIVGIAVAAGNRWVASASPSDSPTGGGRKPAFRLPHPAQGLSASPKHLPTGGGGEARVSSATSRQGLVGPAEAWLPPSDPVAPVTLGGVDITSSLHGTTTSIGASTDR